MGFGLRPDGRLVAVGSLPLGGLPAAPVADAGGVPPGLPPGPITQPPLLAADGRTLYAIVGEQLTQRSGKSIETYRYDLVAYRPAARPADTTDALVDLGVGTAVMGLGVGRRGAVVSLWTSTNGDERAGTGPGAVLVVDPVRLTATTVTRTEDTARVIAAATAVLDGGRSAPAAEHGRWSDGNWWAWHGGRLVGWVGGAPLWLLLLVALVGLAVAVRLAPLPRPGVRVVRVVAGGVAVVAAATVAGAGAVIVAGELLGSPAAGSKPSGDAATPVMPRVLRDQHRKPPRAFDEAGVPVTRRVSAVFDATIAGSEGPYALDAATGRTVRLGDLPGLPATSNGSPTFWRVSPDGRYLAAAGVLLDLETARAWPTALDRHVIGLAVLNDGTVVTAAADGGVWVERPDASGEQVARYPEMIVHGLVPGPGGYVLLRVDSGTPVAAVLGVRTGKVADTRLPADDAHAPLAVNSRGEVVSVSGAPVAASIRERQPLMRAERMVGVSDTGHPVYLSPRPDRPGTPLEIRRAASAGDSTLTQLRFAPSTMQLAADVVAAARPVDVDEPGWAVVADPDSLALAARVLGAGVLVLLLSGMAAAAVRRPRPYRRGVDEPPGAAVTEPFVDQPPTSG
jgi:hypothetical protein